ncbi:Hsp20/alpha crystallin family protein [Haloferula rosea]|uniref:Hsp20/alpha crystallin family protein n=1 Tax=Haloferula rosea TaxID=490093 RepID=A0A934RFW0_9BACT|nr:Hsp20/alpha crystallin family protein [Haloferula rosea]MBK1828838.1 Hsp20/alpha crystallin family protein [Haloferula rosea]
MILPNYLRNSSPWLSEFSRFFESGLRHVASTPPGLRVFDDESGWTLELDYPGVSKDELGLKVENKVLLLEDKREDAGHPDYRLPLGDKVDQEQIKATLENGVLTVRLPRLEAALKSIEIQ